MAADRATDSRVFVPPQPAAPIIAAKGLPPPRSALANNMLASIPTSPKLPRSSKSSKAATPTA